MAPLMTNGVSAATENAPQVETTDNKPQTSQHVFSQTKAAQQKRMQQIKQALVKASQAQRAKLLRNSVSSFVIKGREVYTVRVSPQRNGSASVIPGTMKKFMSLKRFIRFDRKKLLQGSVMYRKAAKIRNKSKRKKQMMKAYQFYMTYRRVGQIKTNKTQQKNNGRIRKVSKKKNVRKRAKKSKLRKRINKQTRKKARVRRRSTRRSRRRQIRKRSKQAAFTVKEGNRHVTYLNSLYRRGNNRAACRSGFNSGFTSGQMHIMFNRYQPNSRRAVIPRRYRIYKLNMNDYKNKPVTVWLVGHRTKNIDHMKKAYYYSYNKQYGGWSDIGYHHGVK